MSWETISHIIFWVFFAFVFIVFLKADAFRQLAIGFWESLVRLWEILRYGIADREAYEANREQREADEAYKKAMKEGKGGGKAGNENEEPKNKDERKGDEDSDKAY